MTTEAVRQVIKSAVRVVPTPEARSGNGGSPEPHPLEQFVELDFVPRHARMVIPGFIQSGLVVIAGAPGAGKTTVLVPLAMLAAGLHASDDELAPTHWRHVVYIAEDVDQVQRIAAGVIKYAGLGIDAKTAAERFHLVPARRMPAEHVAAVGPTYRERFTRHVRAVDIPPLVVIDTRSATIDVSDENDNAEAGRTIATFKQQFADMPVWLVGHLPKAMSSRSDAQALSMRGAGAIEADAHQTVFLVAEKDIRYLVLGKRRFEPSWTELVVRSDTANAMAIDEFGEPSPLALRWGIAAPTEISRKDVREHTQEEARLAQAAALRDEVRNTIDLAWRQGVPLNRDAVCAKVKQNRNAVKGIINTLLAEVWLYEVEVPSEIRTNSNRKSFLVNLTTEEHEAALRGQEIPPVKLEIPVSWRKTPAQPISEPNVAENSGKPKKARLKRNSVRTADSSVSKEKPVRNGRTGTDVPRPPFVSEDADTDAIRTDTDGYGRDNRD